MDKVTMTRDEAAKFIGVSLIRLRHGAAPDAFRISGKTRSKRSHPICLQSQPALRH
ncbi:hypothetical protein [Morganella morganii]|uniref:hypothetical protein n=1 Tax=Morganella morganii TaxID=582 RepID=UPI0015964226|nr:hypothetical protein [Morganella morganii]